MQASAVHLSRGMLERLPSLLPQVPLLVVADQNTQRWIPAALAAAPRHVLCPGEASKSWQGLEQLLSALDEAGLDRDGHLVAVGGGVVTDLGGMAASLHRRGIAWTAAPTSLVGQVDAAIGGKTAVNLGGGKNTVGTFHAPSAVVIDPTALSTLPRRHLAAGLAEVLKTALVDGEELLAHVEALAPDDFAAATDSARAVIEACVGVKQRLVEQDPFDHQARRLLNLGHTFGHALEALALGKRLHGEAVGLGLLCAARLAKGEPDRDEGLEERLRGVLLRWRLPVAADDRPEDVLRAMGRDKKRRAGKPVLVVPLAPGRVVMRSVAGEGPLRASLAAIERSSSTSGPGSTDDDG